MLIAARNESSGATGIDGDGTDNSATSAGAAYVFVRDGTDTWSQQAYLKASNTDSIDRFGFSIAISGDTAVVGARREDSGATGVNGDATDNSVSGAGAAYVFVRDGTGTWSQQAYLKASNTDSSDQFGFSVAVAGDTVVAGAWNEDSSATAINGDGTDNSVVNGGAAYVFVREQWSLEPAGLPQGFQYRQRRRVRVLRLALGRHAGRRGSSGGQQRHRRRWQPERRQRTR